MQIQNTLSTVNINLSAACRQKYEFISGGSSYKHIRVLLHNLSVFAVLTPTGIKMRPLNEEEMKLVLSKLVKYIGDNSKLLLDRKDSVYCLRLHGDRVYYCSETLLKAASNVSRDSLISLGTCFGKFTKTKKFKLAITALDYLAPFAKVTSTLFNVF